MKLSNSDFAVIAVSSIIIAVFSALLYFDYTKRVQVEDLEEIGTITFKKRMAHRQYGGQVVWETIEQHTPVYNHDSIRTADISEAVIHLDDGTDIALDENTLIYLAVTRDEINVGFSHGYISAARTGAAPGDISRLNIKSGDTNVSIDRSDVSLFSTEDEDINLSVSSGTADVNTAYASRRIEENQKLIINPDKDEFEFFDLNFELKQPGNNRYIITTLNNAEVSFRWSAPRGITALLEVAEDRTFTQSVFSRRSASGSVDVSLSPGTYFWRLTADIPDSGEKEFSEVRRLIILEDSPVVLNRPADNQVINYTDRPPLVHFGWNKNEIASSYVVEIASDNRFNDIVQTRQTSMTGIAFDDLADGTYFWRVGTRVSIPGNRDYSSKSRTYSFNISKAETRQPVKLIAPADNTALAAAVAAASGINFSWRHNTSSTKYEFELASDSDFTEIIRNVEISSNFYNFRPDDLSGGFYWRVREISSTPPHGPYSEARRINFIDIADLSLESPGDGSSIILSEKDEEKELNFSWSDIRRDYSDMYLFELASDPGFTDIRHRRVVRDNSITLRQKGPGELYWRVRLLDSENNPVSESNSRSLALSYKDETVTEEPDIPLIAGTETQTEVEAEAELEKADKKDELVAETEPQPLKTRQVKLDRVRWSRSLQGTLSAGSLMADGMIAVGSSDRFLQLYTHDGTSLWRTGLDAVLKSSPVISGDSVYAVDVESNLYTLDIATGDIKWKSRISSPLLFGAKPYVYDNKIYVGTSSGILHVFDKTSGKEIWKRDIESGIFSSIAIYNNTLYIPTDRFRVVALNPNNGRQQWSCMVEDRIVSVSPAFRDNHLYIGDMGGNFYRISVSRKKVVSKVELDSAVLVSPVFYDNSVVIATENGRIYSFNIDKDTGDFSENWVFNSGQAVKSDMGLVADSLIVGSGSSIYSLNINTGTTEWSYQLDDRIGTPVSVKDREIIIGISKGELISVRFDTIARRK